MAEHAAGAAKRRHERRLRQWHRHERMTVAMALAEATHHAAPRGPKTARAGEVEHAAHYGPRAQETPPPGARPGILAEPGLQRSDRIVRRSSGEVPLLTAPLLADTAADAVDARTAKYLLRAALEKLEEEENLEERRKARAHLKAMTELVRRVPRKRKKRRKRKLPRSSSHSSLGRARRRLRQWHARFDVPLRAVCPSVVVRPAMLGIMAGMDEKDSGPLIVDSGSVMCKARFAGYDTPRAVFPLVVALAVYARGDSIGAVLGQGDMPVVLSGVFFHQIAQITVEFPQLPFLDKFVQISCRGAEADSHGPDCSSDHRDSPTCSS